MADNDNDDQDFDLVEIDTTGMPPEFVQKFKGKLVKQPKAKVRELSAAEQQRHEDFMAAVDAHMRRLEADDKKKARGVGNQRDYLKPTTIPPRRHKDTIPMIPRVQINAPPPAEAQPVDPGEIDILSQEQFIQLLEDTMPERGGEPDPRKRVTAKMRSRPIAPVIDLPSPPPPQTESNAPPSHGPVTRGADDEPIAPAAQKNPSIVSYVVIGAAAALLLLGVAWCATAKPPADAHDQTHQSSSGGAVSTATAASAAPKPPATVALTADPPAPPPPVATEEPSAQATTEPAPTTAAKKAPAPTQSKTAEPARPEKTAEPAAPKPTVASPSGPVPMFEREKTP